MGWLDIAFDAAILGTQISQRNKLQQLQVQHAEAGMIQAVVLVLRQEIFKFKQTGEEIVAVAVTYPKQAAGALEILYQRFQQAGLTPDLFPELGDKEYVAATTRYLRTHHDRLLAQLTPADQLEVKNVVNAAIRLPRYNAYVGHYDNVMRYRAAIDLHGSLKGRNNGCLLVIGACIIGFIVLSLFSAGGAQLSGAMDVESVLSTGCLGMVVAIGVAGLFGQWYRRSFARAPEFNQARKVIDELKGQINLEEFAALEKELGTEYEVVHNQQQATQKILNQFFADGNFSAMLSG